MEMYHEEKKWIWEGEGFPHFVYDKVATDSLHYKFGQLKMLGKMMRRYRHRPSKVRYCSVPQCVHPSTSF
jgi:hypothetical protein